MVLWILDESGNWAPHELAPGGTGCLQPVGIALVENRAAVAAPDDAGAVIVLMPWEDASGRRRCAAVCRGDSGVRCNGLPIAAGRNAIRD